mmetsp:Transcript_26615/g.88277  ORF Transcript_26615/g.88277 Transcript_26615/m.88277 type:complete len:277 (+) Transcript_26615:3679-4509(+)
MLGCKSMLAQGAVLQHPGAVVEVGPEAVQAVLLLPDRLRLFSQGQVHQLPTELPRLDLMPEPKELPLVLQHVPRPMLKHGNAIALEDLAFLALQGDALHQCRSKLLSAEHGDCVAEPYRLLGVRIACHQQPQDSRRLGGLPPLLDGFEAILAPIPAEEVREHARIHGELLEQGIRVSKGTLRLHLPQGPAGLQVRNDGDGASLLAILGRGGIRRLGPHRGLRGIFARGCQLGVCRSLRQGLRGGSGRGCGLCLLCGRRRRRLRGGELGLRHGPLFS